MSITSKVSKGSISPEEKKRKIAEAREFHAELLQSHGARDMDFNLKLPWFDKGVKIVGIFPTEFIKPQGFFLEFADSKLDPMDEKRTVYKIGPIENYENIYNLLSSGSYAVPIEDLQEVKAVKPEQAQKFKVNFDTLEEVKDDNISNLTITDFAAIMWMKPVSTKSWLNNLINQNI